jgi:hypothetical protein
LHRREGLKEYRRGGIARAMTSNPYGNIVLQGFLLVVDRGIKGVPTGKGKGATVPLRNGRGANSVTCENVGIPAGPISLARKRHEIFFRVIKFSRKNTEAVLSIHAAHMFYGMLARATPFFF